ncbi:MAG: licC domain protein [Bacteroidales bacterium]|nr:licC domain protein [Bacteroidales bacterium]
MIKNILIITVAGTSSRFSKSLGYDALKCIYEETNKKSILKILMEYSYGFFDEIIIVGGYKYAELQQYVELHFPPRNISLLYNEHYKDYGSNYSLYLGVQEAIKEEKCNIVFVEGDLIIDKKSFQSICENRQSVITATKDYIRADKSVAFYQTTNGSIKYIYDTAHKELCVREPFSLIANSGQIWKFADFVALKDVILSQTFEDFRDTNLNIVQKYFQQINSSEYSIINIEKWYNCNTVEDYYDAIKNMEQ